MPIVKKILVRFPDGNIEYRVGARPAKQKPPIKTIEIDVSYGCVYVKAIDENGTEYRHVTNGASYEV